MTSIDLGGDYTFFGICGHQKVYKIIVDQNAFHFGGGKTDHFIDHFIHYLLTEYILSSTPKIIKITWKSVSFGHHQNGSESAG